MSKKVDQFALAEIFASLDAWISGADTIPARADLATAVRLSARQLARVAPGHSVELRIPPFIAVQCIEGPKHTRGVPPNIIELDARTWLELVAGKNTYHNAYSEGKITASGMRCALMANYLPLI